MMERGEALKLDLSPGDNGPSTHFNSGQSLLERIDRFLGKKKERSAPHGKASGMEIEACSGSNIKSDNCVLECPKFTRLSDVDYRRKKLELNDEKPSKQASAATVVIEDESFCEKYEEEGQDASEHLGNRNYIKDLVSFPYLSAKANLDEEVDKKTREPSAEKGQANPMDSLVFCKNQCEVKSSLAKKKEGRGLNMLEKRKAKEIEEQSKQLAKQEEKKRKLEDKEARRKKQDLEKNAKKAAAMTAKADSLDQCLNLVTAVLDTEFVNDGGGAVLQSLDNMGVSYEVKKLPFDSAIGWMRDRVVYSAEDTGQVKRNSCFEEEDRVLLRLKAAEIAEMICSESAALVSEDKLTGYVAKAMRYLPNKKFTLIVTGMDTYLKVLKAKDSVKKKHSSVNISKSDLEDALLRLQFQHNCCVYFLETMDDLAQFVCSFTKAVAERPYKRTSGVAFNVYMNNHEKGLPNVTKDGHGLLEVWVRQLQQFKGVGYDTAAAIAQKYPSPYLLFKEFKRCISIQEASLLLQNIEIGGRSWHCLGTPAVGRRQLDAGRWTHATASRYRFASVASNRNVMMRSLNPEHREKTFQYCGNME